MRVSFIESCYTKFGWCHWEAYSSLKGNRGAVNLGERVNGEGDWEEPREGSLQLGYIV